VPDGSETQRQRRHIAQIDVALSRTVEIGTGGREKAEFPGVTGELGDLSGAVARRYHLDAIAAGVAKLAEELSL